MTVFVIRDCEKATRGNNKKVKIPNIGQSYKASTIVNYDSKDVIWGIFKSGMPLES